MEGQKLLVIGLDGATFDLIRPWAEAGDLPFFTRMLREGAHAPLRTVPNTDTAPAWTTFATGLNPARHGLFHELSWTADRRTLRPMRGSDREGTPFWKYASDAGREVLAVNVPFSYPAERIQGVMLAGVDAPGPHAEGFCQPPEALAEIERHVGTYRINSNISMAIKEGRPEQGLADAYAVGELHTKVISHLMAQRPWDLAVVVYSIPDEMEHFFWRQMAQGKGPQRDAIRDGYRWVDRRIAQLYEQAGPGTTLLVMSDHGFGPICATPEFLAGWLAEQGFLRYQQPSSQGWQQRLVKAAYQQVRHLPEQHKQALRQWLPGLRNRVESDVRFAGIDWAATTAFAGASPWEIWVSTRGREPQGIVAPGAEYEQVVGRLLAALREWRDPASGQPRLRAAYRREDVYHGPHIQRAPDITLEWNMDVAPDAARLPGNVSLFDADHQPNGVFLALGPGIAPGASLPAASLADVAPTILHILGVQPEVPLDGRALAELLEP
ncbi:hypothetical protein F8S13_01400 [Chloroflexia bacterium SDU3-3]|nr:hypothetical protein F8S13_01400 [Chloroflexia bacterium SDU3-3]